MRTTATGAEAVHGGGQSEGATAPDDMPSFDYVVIGGGSAGCIAAARLAEAGIGRVLLVEAGDPAGMHPETLSADGFKHCFTNDRIMRHRMSTPQSRCGNRSVYLGSGWVLGGSGAVNGMVYTRGDARDFAAWPAGWQWQDLVPAFEAVEARLGIQSRPPTPFVEGFLQAASAEGFARKDGMNDGALSEVVGCNSMNARGDARRSAYRAWLHEAIPEALTIYTAAFVRRLLLDDNGRAYGVEVDRDGGVQQVAIRLEVILCGGALESPKLLQLSGVGPRGLLESLHIPVRLDAPAVGAHLHDHPNVCLFFRGRTPVDFQYPQVYAFGRADGAAPDAAPDTCFVCYAAPASLKESMQRMLPILALPGRLYQLRWLRQLLCGMVAAAFALPPLRRFVSRLFGIVVILGKPASRGQLRIRSADPEVEAAIDPNYYGSHDDAATMAAGIARAQRIARQEPFAAQGVRLLSKAAASAKEGKRRRWMERATMTTFHYCGSCRMGADDDSPVDSALRVKGLANVRVGDASVMPEIPVSALNAPSMVIGYRVAEFILEGVPACR